MCRKYKCHQCGEDFRTRGAFYYHKKTKHGPFKCDQCLATFPQYKFLKQHIQETHCEKPYVCEICRKSFRYRSELNDHRLVHSDEKPHKCWMCDKTYKRKRDLNKHINFKVIYDII